MEVLYLQKSYEPFEIEIKAINNGIRHIIANVLNPATMKLYNASKNRRKSNDTLPPCSWAYVLKIPVIFYFACEFSTAVSPIWEIL